MNRRSLGALVALNVVLVVAVAVVSLTPPPASAQLMAGNNYVMIAGEAVGRTSQNVVYIVQTNTQRMIAVMFNSSNNTFETVAGRDLARDTESGTGR